MSSCHLVIMSSCHHVETSNFQNGDFKFSKWGPQTFKMMSSCHHVTMSSYHYVSMPTCSNIIFWGYCDPPPKAQSSCHHNIKSMVPLFQGEFRSGDNERGQLTNRTLEEMILKILESIQYSTPSTTSRGTSNIQNGDLRLSKQGPNAFEANWLSPYRDLFYFWVPIYFSGGMSIQSAYIQL